MAAACCADPAFAWKGREGAARACRLIMRARGLGDDSPIAVYGTRDQLMRDWPIEENATFIVKPQVRTPDNAKWIYWGDTVVATAAGAKRLGSRRPEIIEIE